MLETPKPLRIRYTDTVAEMTDKAMLGVAEVSFNSRIGTIIECLQVT